MMRTFLLLLITVSLVAGPAAGQGFGDLLNTAKRAKEQVSGRRPKGIGSEAAPAQGRADEGDQHVVFATTPFGDAMTAKTQRTFASTDHLYGRLQLTQSVEEALPISRKDGKLSVYVVVRLDYHKPDAPNMEENSTKDFLYYLTPEMLKQHYLNFDLFSTAAKSPPLFADMPGDRHEPPAYVLCQDRTGEATVTVKFEQNNAGSCTLAAPAGTTSAACQAVKQFHQKELSTQGLPAQFKQASGAFQDPQLSVAAIRRLFQASGGVELYRLVIEPGADYTVVKNGLGIPLYKITKHIYNTYRNKNDGLCYYTHDAIRREYQGNGRYGPPEIATLSVSPVQIDCALAKGGK